VYEPWKHGKVYTEQHVGTVVNFNGSNEKGILIKASALAYAKRIEMQLLSGTELIELQPVFVDYEVNLALLETTTSDALDHLHALSVYDKDLPIEEEVSLLRIESNNHIARLQSSLRKVTFGERIDVSSYPTVNYIFKFSRKELGWSEPIISKGRLVGLSVGQDEEDNVHAIPSTVIAHFLNDDLNEGYQGFPTAGFQVTSLSSPHTREALNLDSKKRGVLITKVSKQGSFYTEIKKGDVLIAIDEKEINSNGNIMHPLWGEISAGVSLLRHYSGDKLSVQILKDKKPITVSKELKRYSSNSMLIPYYDDYGKTQFLIVGGLVFQELTRPFLRGWGPNWMGDAPSSLVYNWEFKNREPTHADERIIILNQILADSINKGYEGIGNAIVKSINGMPIHCMIDLKKSLEKPILKNNQSFLIVKLDYGEGEVILSMNSLKEANARIQENYGVHAPSHFFPTRQ
jgi:hypothetical protein